MEAALWAVGGSLGYIGIAMVAYRIQFVKTTRRYRKWKEEKKGHNVKWWAEYDYVEKRAEQVTWNQWLGFVSDERWNFYPGYMSVWPITLLVMWCSSFLRPEVKGADPTKILNLEKELKELD